MTETRARRRSTVELRMAKLLAIKQQWRCRADGEVWTVGQIHRRDCAVVLKRGSTRRYVRFEALRTDWTLIYKQEAR